ncbi:hypothetical protein PHYBLDRAFT_140527 [Phycomyces blakesleeanus NRRL 1555(-)]|uniref:Uncharacterized protein n=1 Tax=Phycomyces blakesleeanus (strain ATCC 8743b / DSM 1359 / FGSC 10004 / NBRC 33097 / NRRL 1555) TaxID=763407 RepID=A0A163EG45_PHYB8|nr:hypothetical protein PHYBLDRAFT_140527 [Phycomyces blakesleeanus NRRL 1555(-)]OAD78450.1 hypothetical protein PHYBLDRAFT_140527 [Phycomyces blakesleeanus NRRL 1555(-)]|eukprot:XP_018296490.1 hypothetical protein PHYBLDRAFT_140527 [Phycomyces blakesleeanus NRRL 1555(-)]
MSTSPVLPLMAHRWIKSLKEPTVRLVMIRRFHRRDREFLSANQDDDCTDFSDF